MAQVMVGGVWCDTLAIVGGLGWSHRYGDGPGGCEEASWQMLMDPNVTHPELARGRPVAVKVGPLSVWAGLVADLSRDENGWSVTATGLAQEAFRYECLDDSGNPTTNPQTAVIEAIGRGLPWIVPDVWPAGFDSSVSASDTAELNKVSALLDAFCAGANLRWGVGADAVLWFASDPTSPSWVAHPGVEPMGVADDDYVTHLTVRYVSAVDVGPPVTPTQHAVVTVGDDDAAERWGRREEFTDLSGLGLMDFTKATSQAQARLDRVAGRMGWTSGLSLTRQQVTDMKGLPVDFSQIDAGDMLRISGVFDVRGNLTAGTSVDVVLAGVKVVDGEESIDLTPVGLLPRTLRDVIADVPWQQPEELAG